MNSPDDFVPVVSLIRGPLVGTCVACVLYGVTCLQAFFYYQTYVQDRKGLKATVRSPFVMRVARISHQAVYSIIHRLPYYCELIRSHRAMSNFPHRPSAFETVHAALSIWVVDTSLVTASTNPYALQSATWSVPIPVSRVLEQANGSSRLTTAMYIIGLLYVEDMDVHEKIMDCLLYDVRCRITNCYQYRGLFSKTLAQPRSLSFTGAILVQTRLYANSFLASLNIRNANARAYENAEGTPLDLTAVPIEFARPSQPTMDGNMSAVADETVHEPQTAKIDS
ncbi:hypothetical protein ID866_4465 [Astraeus odoratus]|nr:hypothetical protein ID866_4465 [Astraeus odoratus]